MELAYTSDNVACIKLFFPFCTCLQLIQGLFELLILFFLKRLQVIALVIRSHHVFSSFLGSYIKITYFRRFQSKLLKFLVVQLSLLWSHISLSSSLILYSTLIIHQSKISCLSLRIQLLRLLLSKTQAYSQVRFTLLHDCRLSLKFQL